MKKQILAILAYPVTFRTLLCSYSEHLVFVLGRNQKSKPDDKCVSYYNLLKMITIRFFHLGLGINWPKMAFLATVGLSLFKVCVKKGFEW